MAIIDLLYGNGKFELDMEDCGIMEVVNSNPVDLPKLTPEVAVREALAKPVDSLLLGECVKKGEKVCLLVPDVTRLWQSPAVTLPIVVEQLNAAGIPDEDITILFANGTHRRMTDAEHASLVGDVLVGRLRMIDHQCHDKAELKHLGKTSRGTPVWFNRHAVEADKIISICGAVYHFLAGFGGGGKMLLPGIAGDETIQTNHELALNKGFGRGINANARSGNLHESNPFHADIFEAASFLPPVFSVNVVVDNVGNIVKAYAGNWVKAHQEACRLVARMNGVAVRGRANYVIASGGGAPKDINLYQGVKTISNALEAAMPGAVVIAVLECPEGFGNADCRRLVCDYASMRDREKTLRDRFSIGAFAGYFIAQAGETHKLILVTEMAAKDFANTKIKIADNLNKALAMASQLLEKAGEKCIIMPHAAVTLPVIGMQD